MKMREDFVKVRLTAKGAELAGEGALVLQGSRYDFSFKAGEAQEVTRAFDWEVVLARELRDGEPLFELAEASAGEATTSEGGDPA